MAWKSGYKISIDSTYWSTIQMWLRFINLTLFISRNPKLPFGIILAELPHRNVDGHHLGTDLQFAWVAVVLKWINSNDRCQMTMALSRLWLSLTVILIFIVITSFYVQVSNFMICPNHPLITSAIAPIYWRTSSSFGPMSIFHYVCLIVKISQVAIFKRNLSLSLFTSSRVARGNVRDW